MNSPPDFTWIIAAAGDDERKLAQLAMLLTTYTMVISEALDRGDAKLEVYGVAIAMETIGKKFGQSPSDMVEKFLANMRREST